LLARCVLLSFQPLASTMRNHKQLRYLMNPLNSLYAFGQSAFGQKRRPPGVLPLGADAGCGHARRSRRCWCWCWARPAAAATSASTAMRATPRRSWRAPAWQLPQRVVLRHQHRGLRALHVLAPGREASWRAAGSETWWTCCSTPAWRCCGSTTSRRLQGRVRPRAHGEHVAGSDPQLCAGGECLDGILLQGLDARIAALPAERRERGVVLVMHQMGSHGPAYSLRSPAAFKRFRPECASSHLPDCSADAVRNAYDNSIAYTDHVLGETIRWLQGRDDYDTALLYVSDHGESLGENNLYLHGMPYAIAPDVQKHVPWITWMSAGFELHAGLTTACLRGRADNQVSHDNLFHSVLGLLQVSTRCLPARPGRLRGCAAPEGRRLNWPMAAPSTAANRPLGRLPVRAMVRRVPRVAPHFEEQARAHPGLRFAWIDVEDEAEAMGDVDIETFPTLLVPRRRSAVPGPGAARRPRTRPACSPRCKLSRGPGPACRPKRRRCCDAAGRRPTPRPRLKR
jgi:lipid A ethanolaminephosphotransferase